MKEFVFRKNQGFTLVELITVIAIIGILASVTIVSLSGAKIEKELKAAADELASVIREQRNNALTGNAGGNSTCDVTIVDASTYRSTCPNTVNRDLLPGIDLSGSDASFAVPFGNGSGNEMLLQKGGKSIRVCVGVTGNTSVTGIGGSC